MRPPATSNSSTWRPIGTEPLAHVKVVFDRRIGTVLDCDFDAMKVGQFIPTRVDGILTEPSQISNILGLGVELNHRLA
jgi:hypothetical protein